MVIQRKLQKTVIIQPVNPTPPPFRSSSLCQVNPITFRANSAPTFTARSARTAYFSQPPSSLRILTSPSPPTPLPWTWQCHLCNRTYRLSVTRRCLDDGHLFCSGEPGAVTTSKERRGELKAGGLRRAKHKRACASEFDYKGWKAHGEWRRREMGIRNTLGMLDLSEYSDDESDVTMVDEEFNVDSPREGCEKDCDYPSECRWSKVLLAQKERQTREARAGAASSLNFDGILASMGAKANTKLQLIGQDVAMADPC